MNIPLVSDLSKSISRDYGVLLEGGSEDEGEEGGVEGGEGRRRGGFRGGRGNTRGGRGGGIPRPKKEEKEDTRAPSLTTLFVANLPFSLDDEEFAKIFKTANLSYKTAHVVKKRSGRSKGFGFVEFDNESDQQKALTAINNKQVEGRELVVKVALTENKPVEDSKENSTTTTSTTTPSTTTTSTTTPQVKKERRRKETFNSNYN
jgi:RNA recognition motif-containing protein